MGRIGLRFGFFLRVAVHICDQRAFEPQISRRRAAKTAKEEQDESEAYPLDLTVKSSVRRTERFDHAGPAVTPQEEDSCQQDAQ
jgi:hypothetical protein